ncbi:hypothetical protein [Variovorax ginsengisoli]|uniref:Elongation factor EFG domain-containing protein n=1 Tax=Variovorax ginsengisoli TaxID=363844 RepID=A0ABT8SE50_9BURK|nr:hypothetical protein [Variovorax ginsengisoli]MDN8617488.1 hypothetical protein [Variovorax ginsengisoli]MDO1536658.1 hypothetical protein [Variovorax ginsengisoli]
MFNDISLARYPLRQSLLPGARGLRIFESLGVVDWLSRPDRYVVVCEGRGGRIYAADERFLEEAQDLIRNSHGDRVVFREPEVYTYTDAELNAVVEPVMFLRIKVPHAYAREVVTELVLRGVRILEQDMQLYDMVIRAEGTLVNLMGLARSLNSVGQGSVVFWTWLERYERTLTTFASPQRAGSRSTNESIEPESTASTPPTG